MFIDSFAHPALLLLDLSKSVRRRKRGSNEKLSRTKDAMLARKDHQRTRAIISRKRRHWKSLIGHVQEDEPQEDLSVPTQSGSDAEAWEYLDPCDVPTATSYYERFTVWLFSMIRRSAPSQAVGNSS